MGTLNADARTTKCMFQLYLWNKLPTKVEPPTKFSKMGGGGSLTRPQLWEGVAGKEGGNFSGGGLQFYKTIKKSEIFNDKKSL